jgi:penicillin-binding protein 2
MEVPRRNKLLTRSVKTGRIWFPAAPRNSAQSHLMNCRPFGLIRVTALVLCLGLVTGAAFAVTPASTHKKKKKTTKAVATSVVTAPRAVTATASVRTVGATASVRPLVGTTKKPRRWVQTWDEPSYKDSISNDKVDGEDLTVRKAAVDALGNLNGSIVVADPSNGRVLSIVNQPLALGEGFQPCSTVKVSVALAALREGLVERTSPIKFYSRRSMDLTDALAYSINAYFANLGVKLGYERMNYYSHLFGYGEKAGLNIEGEHAGYYPPAPPANGGMGMLTSFGEEIRQTPLELAGLMTAVANGGTLYWLQYPRTQEEASAFEPQVKRHLDISRLIDEIKPGMRGAVEFGTAVRAKQDSEIYGKTGTCSEGKTRLGWFGSFSETGGHKLVVVVMLTGGRPTIGPLASEVAGNFYRNLSAENYFKVTPQLTPALLSPLTR